MREAKPSFFGGSCHGEPLFAIGPFPEDEVRLCAFSGTEIFESDPKFLLRNGDWLSIDAVKEMFETTLKETYYHGVPIEWLLTDIMERFGDRKKRKPMSKKVANAILHKYHFKCASCGSGDRLQVDHIVPVSKGGKDHMENLQILCQPCNLKKGTKSNEQFLTNG